MGSIKKNTPNRIPSTNYFFFFVAVAAVLLAAVTNSTITPAYDVLQFRVHTSLLFAVAVLKFVHFVYDASCAQRTCTHTHKKKSAYFVSVSKSVRQTNKTKRKKKGTAFDEKAKKTCTMPSMRSSPTYCDEKKQRRLQGSAIKYAGARTDGSLIRCFFSMLFYGLTATLRGQREKKRRERKRDSVVSLRS